MKKINWWKAGACALAGSVFCGAMVYYNFVYKSEQDLAGGGASVKDACPDFTLDYVFGVEDNKFVVDTERTFTLSEQKGKVVILNFWATYCDPCREEIPHFNEFYEEYKERDVEVVILNGESYIPVQVLLDGAMNNPANEHYETSYSKWTGYSCTFGRYEKGNNLLALFDIGEALPITVVVDKEGVIQYMGQSKLEYADLERIVLPLLDE